MQRHCCVFKLPPHVSSYEAVEASLSLSSCTTEMVVQTGTIVHLCIQDSHGHTSNASMTTRHEIMAKTPTVMSLLVHAFVC